MTIFYNIDNNSINKMAKLRKKYEVPVYQVSDSCDVLFELIKNHIEFDNYMTASEDISNIEFKTSFGKTITL